MTINEYINQNFLQFKKMIKKMNCLCELKNVSFYSNSVPNYENYTVQLLYALRYHFGYAFEYADMYNKLMKVSDIYNKISVLSVGCGNGIDLWSLQYALSRINRDISIEYYGIDAIDWVNKIEGREYDSINYHICDIADINKNINYIKKFDVIFFPKSISELDTSDLKAIVDFVDQKTNNIYVLSSYRASEYRLNEDVDKYTFFCKALIHKGFKIFFGELDNYYIFNNNVGLIAYDDNFEYPQKALDYVTNLHKKCLSYDDECQECVEHCIDDLNRIPILKTGNIRYNMVGLQRK